ncbi:hypothetical protein AB6A40_010256 [Gnathostoma spinigerum]|uniref:Myeloid leukemia factor 1 n=1 Tax=Gnathostoma spinigerum TaxID=75299 RepID=A0ABD6EWQ0_9BILA
MFGGNDPFSDMFGFGEVHNHMRRQMEDMNRMMNSMMDPFGMFNRRSMYGDGWEWVGSSCLQRLCTNRMVPLSSGVGDELGENGGKGPTSRKQLPPLKLKNPKFIRRDDAL